MDKILTVCIPTFNRADNLKQCILEMDKILRNYNIDLHVFDNASEDNTEKTVQELQAIYPNLKYFRQTHNMGPDFNFATALKTPDTKYVWLLSDKTSIIEKNLSKVLNFWKKTFTMLL